MEFKQCYFDNDSELSQLVELQNEVYRERGLKFKPQTFKSWYVENPYGHVISFNAFDNGKLVAHQSFVPEKMKVNEHVVNCLRSMAVVTHPDYQKKGLFAKLTNLAIDEAKRQGYEFVYAISNANSTPVFLKFCGFQKITQLNVRIGIGKGLKPNHDAIYKRFWTKEALEWRLNMSKYLRSGNYIIGTYHYGVKTLMGILGDDQIQSVNLPKEKLGLGLYLYVGIGSNLPKTYFKVPSFIKHSPFNVIIRNLSDGNLPPMERDNLFYQLLDYDVV